MKNIIITGARQNNLRNISLELPKNKITVFTGVSGSGKSSLVFETIGAEAQRQINETQNSFIRNRLQQMGVADVDRIENLNVPVMINQKRIGGNARSTVGTATDIYAHLRLLFSRLGEPFVGYSNVFSFNNPDGMCPVCEGLGKTSTIDVGRLFDLQKSLNEGAILFPTFQPGGWRWTRYVYSGYFDNDKKLKDYTKKEWELLLHAEEHKPLHPAPEWGKTVLYEGVLPRIEKSLLKKDSREFEKKKAILGHIIHESICPACKGARLNPKVLSCKIAGYHIAACAAMPVDELLQFVSELQESQYDTVIKELKRKLKDMVAIGLQYLTLDRVTASLSGGESQRIKMVRHLGNSLVDILYIFDEPSIGLHPKDVDNINRIMLQLKDKGNTILVVEHDPDIIRIADHIVDMGPRSGRQGGDIVYEGSFGKLKKSKGLTGQYFAAQRTFNVAPRPAKSFLKIEHANLHNLKDVSVAIPEKVLTAVTGVAGSGKSSLINKILPELYPGVRIIDQSLFAASARSNLLTYLDIANAVRKLFALANGVTANRFSTNSTGACAACKGLGIQVIDLAFMEDVREVCEVCGGSGFDPAVLVYKFEGKNIAEVHEMTISEAEDFFSRKPFAPVLNKLNSLGLGYLALGQRLSTLSGGERQRLKLARELDDQDNIIVLDEPSTGLHPSDTIKLMQVIQELVNHDNTVIVIEHNLDIIAAADWIIDLGPGAGTHGGRVMFEGTVATLLTEGYSETGKYLRKHLGRDLD
jgi:excinuclease ABC A subunit